MSVISLLINYYNPELVCRQVQENVTESETEKCQICQNCQCWEKNSDVTLPERASHLVTLSYHVTSGGKF